MSLRILFVPFGSEGDVNPLFWVAEAMAARGHRPEFLLTPHYGHLADRRGFPWTPLGTEEDFLEFARNPLLWHPRRGPEFVVKGMLKTLPGYREALEKLPGTFDLMVTSTFALGAACFAEQRGIPRLTVHMQPVCLRSLYDFPLFLPELAWACGMPLWCKRLFYKMVDLILWSTLRGPFNAFRREMGLPPQKDFYEEAVNGAKGIAALFPDWFAPPQIDWPRNLRQFGFPVAFNPQPLPEDLQEFLTAGPPPILWTHGSANFDIGHFQSRALQACEELGQRCLLISLNPPKVNLPARAFHVSHVRFEDLFPHCAAIVHHGGIGTTAKAIASGIPQLIVPRSHDQPDNANRIVRLGLGKTLGYRDLDRPILLSTLRTLLDSPEIKSRCFEYQARMMAEDRRGELCDWAESLVF